MSHSKWEEVKKKQGSFGEIKRSGKREPRITERRSRGKEHRVVEG
jgi:hypothetical protein